MIKLSDLYLLIKYGLKNYFDFYKIKLCELVIYNINIKLFILFL